jgi:hypothetical protein
MNLKNFIAILLLIIISTGCRDDKEKLVEVVDEVPNDIVPSKLCETLHTSIIGMFPEYKNNQVKYSTTLFNDTVQDHIILTQDADVYVSFVYEGATITNTLGWYSYTQGETPGVKDIKKELVFPNISNSVLTAGDTRHIGRFKAGTVVGFYLIVGGFNNNTVDYRKPTLYTNHAWNTGENRQHVLFLEQKCGDVVIGFEDKQIVLDSDADYNDVIFTVSDNNTQKQTVSFDLQQVARM